MMQYKIDEIDLSKLELGGQGYASVYFIKNHLKNNDEVSDEMLSWIVNPFPAFASADKERMKQIAEKQAIEYEKNRKSSLEIVRLIKNEFYDFCCNDSSYYKKEQTLIGGNINTLITGLATAIATKIGGIELGVVVSFVTAFMMVLLKMGKKVICDTFKSGS